MSVDTSVPQAKVMIHAWQPGRVESAFVSDEELYNFQSVVGGASVQ